MTPLLDVKNLVTKFYTREGIIHAVNGVSFSLPSGSTLGIVGESGSGKSVSMLSLLRLIPEPPGKIEEGVALFHGQDLLKISEEEIRKIRGQKIGMVYQDPMTSLNPVLRIGDQIMETIKLHQGIDGKECLTKAIELLTLVGIPCPEDRVNDYPHKFSGGMRQRVMIAMALAGKPQLLIADEPTTALDVTIQSQIIHLVKRIQQQVGMSVIWITHDLGVVARIAQRVAVMYAGKIVEEAPVKELFKSPMHPYTIGLLQSLPKLNEIPGTKLYSIPGQPPNLINTVVGCSFEPRCRYSTKHCREITPPDLVIGNDHYVSCLNINDISR